MKKGVLDRKHGDCRKTIVFPTICVLTSQNTDIRKFPCGNFRPLKVSKPRYTPLIDDTEACCHLFQLRFFITGNQIIISDQFVSPVCSSVMNFPIVTTSALFCDSMIAEIAQIGDVRKIPCREIFSAGDSCLYGSCALILNCFVISAVHWIRSFSLG